ncbi:MAG: CARDB domain-containing protein, partial [Phycisphaerales bacterium]
GIAGALIIAAMGAIMLPMAAAGTQTTKQSSFTATLPTGAAVELIGVCNWPAGGPVCWKADGSALDKPVKVVRHDARTDADDYGFMLRVRGPKDMEVKWNNVEGADGWGGTCDVVDVQGSRLDDCTGAVASLPGEVTRTALRVGVAAGPWTTISTHDGGRMGYSGDASVLWSQAFEDSDGTSVVATAEWRKDRTERIVAIDRAGTTHASPGGSVAVGNMDQMTTRFDGLKRGQIKEFQYQVRPYEWADFKDVSLRPELGAAPRVEWVRPGKGSDAAIEGFKVQPGRTEGMYAAAVSIRNRGEAACPQIIVRFQVGDRTVDAATYLAGPFKPGEVWNAASFDFVPMDGVRVIQVSLDPDDQVEELDETNNQASLRIVVKDGQVVEQSIAPAPTESDSQDQAVRAKSAETLRKLIRAALIWSNDHDDRLPDSVAVLEDKLDPADKEWLLKNAAYLGKGMSLWTEDPGHVVAYDKTLLAKGNGTNVVYLDCHVAFENPRKLGALGIVAADSGAVRQDNDGEAFRSYQVNRSVADFPAGEDFSTPEAAYATINRMDTGDPAVWKKVSVARLAARMGENGSERKRTVDPEWAKVLANARIREVVVWNVTKASVIAELPQELSSKKIVDPFDARYLQLENGRWLNNGNDRFASVEAAKAKFMSWMKRETSEVDAMRDPLAHADEIKAAAAQLFEKLRTADYAKILSYYHDGKWDDDGWKQFPTLGLYTVGTNYPSFALWCATHFKDNPIIDVQLGDVFLGDALVADKTGRPTVPYKLTLKDGSTLAGNLPFYLSRGKWIGLEGIDWHLWPNTAK